VLMPCRRVLGPGPQPGEPARGAGRAHHRRL